MTKVLIIGGDCKSVALSLALAEISRHAHEVILYARRTHAMFPTRTIVIRPRSTDTFSKPHNHPDGWYRQFEKRTKRK